MFRRILDALREHRPEEALELSGQAIGEAVGVDVTLVDSLTGQGLVTFLSAGGTLDPYKTHILAELLIARAEAYEALDDRAEALRERDRARELLMAVAPSVEGEQAARVRELLGWLDGGATHPDT